MSTDLRAVALRRKLKSLQYPHTDSFDYLNEGSFRSLIAWLEDTKICHYKIEERESLRATDSDGWKHAFDTYLEDLQCNRTGEAEQGAFLQLDWLLGYAVSLVYADDKEVYTKHRDTEPEAMAAAELTKLHLSKASIEEIARLLLLPPHHDPEVLLKIVAEAVSAKLSPEAIEASTAASSESRNGLSIDGIELGFDTGDKSLNRACKVLRLLHINDLRDLQTRINELIVAIQNMTADPKTNTTIGKVGYG